MPDSLARIIFNPDYRPPRNVIRLWVEELVRPLTLSVSRTNHGTPCACRPWPSSNSTMSTSSIVTSLKSSNIFVTWDGHIALADFGTSLTPKSDSCSSPDKPFDQCVFFAYGGTYAYQAPELLIKHARASFTCSVDMWSLGVVIYEMYTGKVSLQLPTPNQT